MRKEVQIFFTAVMFYTRIPCPSWVDHSEEYLNKATRYFPLMGWIVGGISSLAFIGAVQVLPMPIAIILSMVASILTTGAFHEDGWADVCDGFGGGWTKDRILTIMKDSVIGAYGVVGVVLILLMKFVLLSEIAKVTSLWYVVYILLAAHGVSRFTAVTMIFTHSYVRENEDSKAKPVAKKLPISDLIVAAFFGLIPLLLFQNPWYFTLILPCLLIKMYLAYYFKKWIGGYTGDCLGATQQLTEIIFYLGLLILWKFI